MIITIALVFCIAMAVFATVVSIGYLLYTLWQIPCNCSSVDDFIEFVLIPIITCILFGMACVMIIGLSLAYMGVI